MHYSEERLEDCIEAEEVKMMKWGVLGHIREWSLDKHLSTAEMAEKLGYDSVWVNDNVTGWDPFIILADIARKTQKVQLGINVAIVNPKMRNPAVMASSAATVNEISGGRMLLGVGCGGPSLLNMVDAEFKKPLKTTREAIEIISRLLAGETIQKYEGEFFKQENVKLEQDGYHGGHIPILVGAQGPKYLELSGEIADGVNIPGGTLSYYRFAVENFNKGVKKSGRKLSDMMVCVNVNCYVSDDRSKAIKEARLLLANSISSRRPTALKAMNVSQEMAKDLRTNPDLLSDEYVLKEAICGTVDDCIKQVDELEAIGVNHIILRFHEPDTVETIGKAIISKLKAR